MACLQLYHANNWQFVPQLSHTSTMPLWPSARSSTQWHGMSARVELCTCMPSSGLSQEAPPVAWRDQGSEKEMGCSQYLHQQMSGQLVLLCCRALAANAFHCGASPVQ